MGQTGGRIGAGQRCRGILPSAFHLLAVALQRMRRAKCCCALAAKSGLQSFPRRVASGRGLFRLPAAVRAWPGCLHRQPTSALQARIPIPRECGP
eukprot:746354-Pleurochrysis_carterae.AAC.1